MRLPGRRYPGRHTRVLKLNAFARAWAAKNGCQLLLYDAAFATSDAGGPRYGQSRGPPAPQLAGVPVTHTGSSRYPDVSHGPNPSSSL